MPPALAMVTARFCSVLLLVSQFCLEWHVGCYRANDGRLLQRIPQHYP
jgi:hypothetical protein